MDGDDARRVNDEVGDQQNNQGEIHQIEELVEQVVEEVEQREEIEEIEEEINEVVEEIEQQGLHHELELAGLIHTKMLKESWTNGVTD